ncbi:MAG: AI-2E family transporter [Actinomycetaceae bacterium]|nr:AI-2E family transporter [Actinomycetaceae bacterium]
MSDSRSNDTPASAPGDVERAEELTVDETVQAAEEETPKGNNGMTGIAILRVLALLAIAGIGLHSIQGVFAPVFFALTLVLAIRPLGRFLIRKNMPSWLASTVTIVVLFVLILGMLGVTIWALAPVPETLMNYSANFEALSHDVLRWLQEKGVETDDISTYFNQVNFNAIVSWAWSLVDSIFSFGGLMAMLGVSSFFLTIDTMITRARGSIIDISHSNLGQALIGFETRVRHYWIVSSFFGLVVAAIDGAVLQVMGIPLAWTWAYWAFITNYIPNIGFFIGVVPPMLMALLDQGWESMVWVLVLYSVINVVIQTFIQPKFTGDIVGLSPTVTFISLMVWTSIVGVLGSILAVPLTLFFKALLVDSDPKTRWLDAFLVSETEAKRRKDDGRYDIEDPAEEELPHLTNPLAPRKGESVSRRRKRTKPAAISRQLSRKITRKK